MIIEIVQLKKEREQLSGQSTVTPPRKYGITDMCAEYDSRQL